MTLHCRPKTRIFSWVVLKLGRMRPPRPKTPHIATPNGKPKNTPTIPIDTTNCPLLHQLSSLHIQPMKPIHSSNTYVHPDDLTHDSFSNDKITTNWNPKARPIYNAFGSAPDVPPDQLSGDPYTPPIVQQTTLRQINIHNITKHKVPKPPPVSHDTTVAIWAQLDTGADITCTNLMDILHMYCSYTSSFPCKV